MQLGWTTGPVCETLGVGVMGDTGGPEAVCCCTTACAGLHSWGYTRAGLPKGKRVIAESNSTSLLNSDGKQLNKPLSEKCEHF